jgi:hypothetical protein
VSYRNKAARVLSWVGGKLVWPLSKVVEAKTGVPAKAVELAERAISVLVGTSPQPHLDFVHPAPHPPVTHDLDDGQANGGVWIADEVGPEFGEVIGHGPEHQVRRVSRRRGR